MVEVPGRCSKWQLWLAGAVGKGKGSFSSYQSVHPLLSSALPHLGCSLMVSESLLALPLAQLLAPSLPLTAVLWVPGGSQPLMELGGYFPIPLDPHGKAVSDFRAPFSC